MYNKKRQPTTGCLRKRNFRLVSARLKYFITKRPPG
nr:MAG TPA: hypothetical protein [Caudoviricetes sp.]